MSRVTKNVLYNLMGQGGLAILSLLAAKTTFRQLGEDVFGIFLLGNTLVLLVAGISRNSFSTVIAREIARYLGNDSVYVRRVTQTASIAHWGIFALFAILIYFGSPWMVENWIRLSSFPSADAIALLRIVAIGSMLAVPNMLIDSFLRGLEEMWYSNVTDLFVAVVYRGGLILLVSWGGNWQQAAWWYFGTNMLAVAILYLAVLRFIPMLWLRPRYYGEVIARNLSMIRQLFFSGVAGLVHQNGDKIIVSRLMPISHFGYYTFAYSFIGRATIVQSAVATAAIPAFSRLIQAGNRRAVLDQYLTIHQLLAFGLVPFFAAICFGALPLYTYIFSAQVANLMLLPTTLLAVGSYLSVAMVVPYSVATASGRTDIDMRANLYALVFVLPITFLLIYYWGLVGGGISWIIFRVFICGYSISKVSRDCLGIPATDWYTDLGIVGLCALSTYGVAWVALSYIGTSIEQLSLAFLVASVVYGLIIYRRLTPGIRARIHRLLSNLQSQWRWRLRDSREI